MRISVSRVLLGLAALLATVQAIAAPRAAERRQFEAAYQVATRGPIGAWKAVANGLDDYPLYPYLEYVALTRDLGNARPVDVTGFLDRQQGSVLERDLRSRWLRKLANGLRWTEFRKLYRNSPDLDLRCADAAARVALNDTKALLDDAKALWLTGQSLPKQCDAVVAWLKAQREFGPELVWERIRLAAAARETALIAHLATLLGQERGAGQRWAAAIANPAGELQKVASWPDTPRDRELAGIALAQLARRDAALAALRWPAIERRYQPEAAERAPGLNAIALYKAASYAPDAAAWLARVPPAHTEESVQEWRMREALARRDYPAVIAAFDLLDQKKREDARFRYIRARVLEELGRKVEAAPGFATLAREPNYHGFLAADHTLQPYAICPEDQAPPPAATQGVESNASLKRAFELYEIDWKTFARREWDFAVRDAGAEFRRAAVVAAHRRGWVDRGPLTLLKPEETRWYALRFPLRYEKEVERGAARHGLDASWVFALIRSESAWVADARSTADARGLMQLLPAVGAEAAKREKVAWRGADDLFRPEYNIALGTSHLAVELRRHGGRVWLATAAYNAGPAPVRRWLAQRPTLPTDLWIETIPYKETREYVSRVLAFSVIYDWRLHGDAAPLGARIARAPARAGRRDIVCPVKTASLP